MSDGGGFSITGQAAIQHAEIHRLIGALGLQAQGYRFKLPNLRLAQQWCGSEKRTAKGVLEDLVLWFYANGGTINAQWNTVGRALGEDRAAKLRRKAEKVRAEHQKAQEVKEIEDLLKPLD